MDPMSRAFPPDELGLRHARFYILRMFRDDEVVVVTGDNGDFGDGAGDAAEPFLGNVMREGGSHLGDVAEEGLWFGDSHTTKESL